MDRGVLVRNPHLVVGAGVKGMTVALTLARRGQPVVVAERDSRPGGQARSFHYGPFTFDLGLHVFVSRNRRVLSLARGALGGELLRFSPRAASKLANGSLVDDSSRWCRRSVENAAAFYNLVPSVSRGWNCMQVSKPPVVFYPRRGGFGRLCESLAREFVSAGGLILYKTQVSAGNLAIENGRVASVKLGRRSLAVRAVHWTVGSRLLARRPAPTREFLVLNHFMVRGPAPTRHHWVRLFDADKPFLPQLVYFPARFSANNAPRGCHGLGAVVALRLERRGRPEDRRLARWIFERPRMIVPAVTSSLQKSGLLDPSKVIGVRQELVAVPPNHDGAVVAHAFERVRNLYDCDRWLRDDPSESGAPLQMAAALRAAEAALRS